MTWPASGLAGALLLVACGSSSPGGSSGARSSPVPVATVATASSGLGQILVDGTGKTLYVFDADKGASPTCYGSCIQLCPALLTSGSAKAGTGVDASKLSTSARTDGTTQVTYGGHPLYLYVGDSKPGDVTGQGVNSSGGLWHVVSPSGSAIT